MNENDRLLCAYVDDELGPDERIAFEAHVAADPAVGEQLAVMRATRALIVGEAERETADVPEARFEQIWDRVDDELYGAPASANASVVSMGGWRRVWPMFAVAAAAAVLIVIWPGDSSSPSQTDTIAKAPSTPPLASAPPGVARPKAVALPSSVADAVAESDVHIERIEFAGESGRIAQIDDARGTTTVIWIEEDPQPVDSERSL